MKELVIKKNEEGLTLNKYFKKVFTNMSLATYHKLLRKKYFEVNGIKAKGSEVLITGDIIRIFLSDDTYNSFLSNRINERKNIRLKAMSCSVADRIIYEDEQIILYNKEVGLLSHGDKSNDESVNTILNDYLGIKNNNIAFVPSVVNRLDRNTSGIIIFAKNYVAAREISKMIKDNKIEKHYLALVNGKLEKDNDRLINLFKKDEATNKAIIKEYKNKLIDGYSKVELVYKVLKEYNEYTLLDVKLVTGKSHQIRAQLSYIGHPIVCDKKYMNIDLYKKNIKNYKSKTQKLSCYKIKFSHFEAEPLKHLSNKEFKIDVKNFILEY